MHIDGIGKDLRKLRCKYGNNNNKDYKFVLIHTTFIDRNKQKKLKMAPLEQRNSVVVPNYIQN